MSGRVTAFWEVSGLKRATPGTSSREGLDALMDDSVICQALDVAVMGAGSGHHACLTFLPFTFAVLLWQLKT